MKIYFAHSVSEYGTEFEAAVVKALKSDWLEVENPNAPHHQEGYRQHGMAYFEGVIAQCDALAYLRFPDGAIGAGVAKEIASAANDGRPVFEVRVHEGAIHICASAPKPGPVLTVEQTRLKLGRAVAPVDADAQLGASLANHLAETHRLKASK